MEQKYVFNMNIKQKNTYNKEAFWTVKMYKQVSTKFRRLLLRHVYPSKKITYNGMNCFMFKKSVFLKNNSSIILLLIIVRNNSVQKENRITYNMLSTTHSVWRSIMILHVFFFHKFQLHCWYIEYTTIVFYF